jgi:DNA-3-methyladenine glycosylase II
MFLQPQEPFDFLRTLRFILSPPALLNGRQFEPLLDHFVDGEYRRVTELGGDLVLYGVREERQAARSGLRIRILAGGQGGEAASQQVGAGGAAPGPNAVRTYGGGQLSLARLEEAVAAEVAKQFSTELDLLPFYALAASDPVLRRLVVHFHGMRIPQAPRVFETLISAIIEQQVNLSFAHKVKKALIETYGRTVEYEGRRYSAFPEPAALAITTPRELRRLQVSGPKARYIIGISRLALDGTLDLENLRHVEPALAHKKLLEQKGVGNWTAQYVGLRALGHLDCLPAADVGLQKVVRHFYRLRKPPTAQRVEKLARAWQGWRSYATFYLWLTYWETAEWKNEVRKGI